MIKAEIIADSLNEYGDRITTYVLTFPRIILAELNTHRLFSRNSASSRAIPFIKMVEMVRENPFIPIAWQKDHKGMQGKEYITDPMDLENIRKEWLEARDKAVEQAITLNKGYEVTKQLCNRLLEPFMWHKVILTATEFDNFFNLRCPQYYGVYKSWKDLLGHKDVEKRTKPFVERLNESQSEIHIQLLSEAMWDAMNESEPKQLKAGEWHIPFGDKFDDKKIEELFGTFEKEEVKIKIATARCARVSYLNFEGKDDYEADIKLHDRLAKSGHWSPFEHCARAMSPTEYSYSRRAAKFDGDPIIYDERGWSGNFKGFIQYRKMFEGEHKFNPQTIKKLADS